MVNVLNVIKAMIFKMGNAFFLQRIYKLHLISGAGYGTGKKEFVYSAHKDGHLMMMMFVSQSRMIVENIIIKQVDVQNVIKAMILSENNV